MPHPGAGISPAFPGRRRGRGRPPGPRAPVPAGAPRRRGACAGGRSAGAGRRTGYTLPGTATNPAPRYGRVRRACRMP